MTWDESAARSHSRNNIINLNINDKLHTVGKQSAARPPDVAHGMRQLQRRTGMRVKEEHCTPPPEIASSAQMLS